MSNSLSLAAATTALRNLLLAQIPVLDGELADLEVTTQPLDLARKNITKAQLNLFLYLVTFNSAWRNMDLPRQVRPGETAPPPLALNLHFLLTGYGRGEVDTDALSHRVLAAAMSVLHDHPLLSATEIRSALADNDLADQIERIRITPQPMTMDDMSKLWTACQASYRTSTAYEVSVALIDSRAAGRAPLPVLRRGPQDRGVTAVASAAPAVTEIQLPRAQSAVRLGETLVLRGRQLRALGTVARFASARSADPIDVEVGAGSEPDTLQVRVPAVADGAGVMSQWSPGIHTICVRTSQAVGPTLSSNEVPIAIAPSISVAPLTAAAGTLALTLKSTPRLREGQRVYLLFGDTMTKPTSILQPADVQQPTELTFELPNVAAGTYTIRLRVDGADSIPVDFSATPPAFDPNQQVTVT